MPTSGGGASREVTGPTTNSLEQLLADTAKGDQDAFAELYDATAPRLHGLIARIVGSGANIDDITQEAFLDIWRTCTAFDPQRGSALGWMMTIAHRRAVDAVRSSRAAARRDEAYERARARDFDTTSEHAERELQATTVRSEIAALNSTQREALELVYLQGYTQREAAQRLDVPLGTLKSRIRDGLRRLRLRGGRLQ